MFAGEGDAFRTNRRFKKVSEGMPAKRLSTAFDSVTLYGCDPDERPDIYGKIGNSGVSIATLDDMKVLYSRLRPVRPDDLGVDDHQRPGADDPGHVLQHRHRPADRQVHAPTTAASRPRTRPRRSANGRCPTVRGTVQADILKEDQGQNTCIFSTEFALKMMGDIQEYFVAPPGAQLLLGVDLRLPHRRGRRQPDLAARLHPGQRLHLRRVLPGARHAHRRLRAQPVLLLLQRHGPGILGDRPRGPPHLGRGDEEQVRRQRAQPEAQVPHPDLGPLAARPGDGLQRHPHHAAGADRHLRQLQLACTPTPTTRRSPRRPRNRCAAPWPSS